ncbi:ABC transporter permease [Euzebya rosea]|uniref:ABC transporter permease n=1 Tax=Euzebya rosea TaxID=2052804 RepID=UPI000D3ECA40|nr:ABC transporter permease [Euzebya rosea]
MNASRVLTTWIAPVAVALLALVGLMVLADAPPGEALSLLVSGSLGSTTKLADTFVVWVPLALAAASLSVTFTAGLWNIGVEGQIIAGGIGAAWASRIVPGPAVVVLTAAVLAGVAAGMAWGLLTGVLKVRGRVNEIFAGVGLNFAATGLAIYLIIGPWSRSGVASTSGTDLFREEAWFPTLAGLRLAPVALGLALLGVVGVWLLLRGTRFGLRLRAVGANPAAAERLGVAVQRTTLAAFAIGGGLAGLAGALQVGAVHHKLVPAISGGYGFVGILLVLLTTYRVVPAAALAVFFAAVGVGASQLELRLDLDSALAGVFTATLVLLVLIARGVGGLRRRPSVVDPLRKVTE